MAILANEINRSQAQKSELYMVATPIGHRGDITQRAREIFASVDIIACEDTRVTGELLRGYGISTQGKLMSVREHNEREAAAQLIERLRAGASVAYASDAGTPGVSDPGARLVDAVRAAGLRVVPVPGASALTALLSASGIQDPTFIFEGFVPNHGSEREVALSRFATQPRTSVFYEATHRIEDCLARLARLCPERTLVIGKELTKHFERIVSLPAGQAVAWLAEDKQRSNGEFVLALAPIPAQASPPNTLEAKRWLDALAKELPPARAAKTVAKMTGVPRETLYRSLSQADDGDDNDGAP
jgi:16S rRNA (cytidine1402-2'-O)-methyltransferase